MTTKITRRAAIAALALAAPSLALAAEPKPIERTEVPETEVFVSDLLNWEGTTDEEWASLSALLERYMAENPDAEKVVAERHEALAAKAEKADEPAADSGEEFGDFSFHVSTPGGTTEDGNIPQWLVKSTMSMAQCGITLKDGGGKIYQVLYDGEYLMDVQFDIRTDTSLSLTGDQLEAGIHTVEVVLADGDEILAHRSAQIEIVQQ